MSELEKRLAFSIIYHIIRQHGGKADYGTIKLEFFRFCERISQRYDINVIELFEETINQFPIHERTSEYCLPIKREEIKTPEEIAQEIQNLYRSKNIYITETILRDAEEYRKILQKMNTTTKYLSKWNYTPRKIIRELYESKTSEFFSKYNNPPAHFEFLCSLAFSSIFQIPLESIGEYEDLISSEEEKVIWRGGASLKENTYVGVNQAPGGGADIVIKARGFFILAECTLRYSKRQWKEEIEPIFRHLTNFKERYGITDVFLIFVTAYEILNDTYNWISSQSERHNVVIINVDDLIEIMKTSLFIPGLPHVTIRKILNMLYKFINAGADLETYNKNKLLALSSWRNEILLPYEDLFLTFKTYEIMRSRMKSISQVIHELARNNEVKDYLNASRNFMDEAVIRTHIDNKKSTIIKFGELLGLFRELNGSLAPLEWGEFENTILKILGYLKQVQRENDYDTL